MLAVIVILLPAGMWDLRGPDEGRYTQIAHELLGRGNWFILTVFQHPYDQKPPLAFWLMALAIELSGGIHSWALRTPSVLAGIGMLVTTYFVGRRFGGPRAGYLSGIFLLSSLSFLDDSAVVELNMFYGFFITASLAVWLLKFGQRLSWSRALLMWVLLACAFLVKGPLALLIVISGLAGTAISQRSFLPFLQTRAIPGLLLVGCVAAGWLYTQGHAWGSGFVQNQVSSQTVTRFLHGDHTQPFYYYFPRIFTAILGPWGLVLIAAAIAAWRNRGKNPEGTGALVGWLAFPFLVFVIAHGKRVPYLVPLLSPACLLAGIWASRTLAERRVSRTWFWLIAGVTALVAIALITFGLVTAWPGGPLARPDFRGILNISRLWWPLWLLAGVFLGFLGFSWWKSSRTWMEAFWAVALCILVVQFMDFTTVRPALDPGKSTRHFSDVVTKFLADKHQDTVLTFLDLSEPEYHVYGTYKTKSFREKKADLDDPALPDVLALKGSEIKSIGPAAIKAGYQPAMALQVTKRPVQIYVRN